MPSIALSLSLCGARGPLEDRRVSVSEWRCRGDNLPDIRLFFLECLFLSRSLTRAELRISYFLFFFVSVLRRSGAAITEIYSPRPSQVGTEVVKEEK